MLNQTVQLKTENLTAWLLTATSANDTVTKIIQAGSLMVRRKFFMEDSPQFKQLRAILVRGRKEDSAFSPIEDEYFPYTLAHVPFPSIPDHASSPVDLPYQRLCEELTIGVAEHVFLTQGHPSTENVTYFFRAHRLEMWLMITLGGRYSEGNAYLYDGDPVIFAGQNRAPIRDLTPEGLEAKRRGMPIVLPTELAFDQNEHGGFVNPRAIALRDVWKARIAYRFTGNSDGESWLEDR